MDPLLSPGSEKRLGKKSHVVVVVYVPFALNIIK